MSKDFWRKSTIAIMGGGSWGTVLANLVAENVEEVRVWMRTAEAANSMNSTRTNQKYLPQMKLHDRIRAYHEMERVFETKVDAIIWALPSKASRETAKTLAPLLRGDEVILHATKGVEEGTLKRVSEILQEELPCMRIGVISGPNLAKEVANGEPAATVVASVFDEVIEVGKTILASDRFRVYGDKDVIGVEWAGTLKNILAIASGCLDSLELGWNSRSLLISRGLAEFVRFGIAMGGSPSTFLGLAGVGDLLATCSSSLSRNYRVGYQLAKGESLESILQSLGQTAEGVRTVSSVYEFAKERKIEMPICGAVYQMIRGEMSVREALDFLMKYPMIETKF